MAGSGVTGDLLAHSIDTAEWLNGPIQRVVAHTETFIKERKHAETGKIEPVTIDDACMFLAIFANGSCGTFESTRYARGRKNYNTFEINGENGSVFFDLEDPHILQYFRYADPATGKKIEDHLTGWQRIHVTNFEHPYMKNWWVPGCTIGYEHTFINGLADFLASLEGGPAFQRRCAPPCGRNGSATRCLKARRAASGWRSRGNRSTLAARGYVPAGFCCPWNWLGFARGQPLTSSTINCAIAMPGRSKKDAGPRLIISSVNVPLNPG